MGNFTTSGQSTAPLKKTVQVTIANGQTVSTEAIDFRGFATMTVFTGPDFDGATLGFSAATSEPAIQGLGGNTLISAPTGTYTAVVTSGATLSVAASASEAVSLAVAEAVAVRPAPFLRVTAGAQTGDTVLTIALSS